MSVYIPPECAQFIGTCTLKESCDIGLWTGVMMTLVVLFLCKMSWDFIMKVVPNEPK